MRYTIEVDVERVGSAQMCETWDIPQLVRPGHSVIARCGDVTIVLPERILKEAATGIVTDINYADLEPAETINKPERSSILGRILSLGVPEKPDATLD